MLALAPGPSHTGNYNPTAPFDPCSVVPGWTGSGASSPDARLGRTERVESVFRDACDYAASGVEYAGATAGRGCGVLERRRFGEEGAVR